jgi:dihydroorotate dehydrogenase
MLYRLARPLLFALDPELTHDLALQLADAPLRFRLVRVPSIPPQPLRVFGLDFPNPVGLAAGLDKNAAHIDALSALGFGFIEVGTVTPRPQPGNPKPRMFRLPAANAIINRFGFNNVGVQAFVDNVKRSSWRGVLGINIGKNFDTPLERAADDYVTCLEAVYQHATYVTVNVSSPNTQGLRALQEKAELDGLLGRIAASRKSLADRHGKRVPLLLKIAPDLDGEQVRAIVGALLDHGFDGVIATNTSLSREGVDGLKHADEKGGLSGMPIRERATQVLRTLAAELKGELPIIGVGGIQSGADAKEKIAAGASLVQLYTGLVYRGPALVAECASALRSR